MIKQACNVVVYFVIRCVYLHSTVTPVVWSVFKVSESSPKSIEAAGNLPLAEKKFNYHFWLKFKVTSLSTFVGCFFLFWKCAKGNINKISFEREWRSLSKYSNAKSFELCGKNQIKKNYFGDFSKRVLWLFTIRNCTRKKQSQDVIKSEYLARTNHPLEQRQSAKLRSCRGPQGDEF